MFVRQFSVISLSQCFSALIWTVFHVTPVLLFLYVFLDFLLKFDCEKCISLIHITKELIHLYIYTYMSLRFVVTDLYFIRKFIILFSLWFFLSLLLSSLQVLVFFIVYMITLAVVIYIIITILELLFFSCYCYIIFIVIY